MLDVQEKHELAFVEEPKPSVAEKRAAIESELRDDPSRSDREIGRTVGVDHKTVAKARSKIIPIASPAGSPWKPETPAVEKEPEFDPFEPGSEEMVVHHQPAIAVYPNPFGAIVIRQECTTRDDEDPVILVRPEHLDALIVRLRKFLP